MRLLQYVWLGCDDDIHIHMYVCIRASLLVLLDITHAVSMEK